MLFLDRHLLCKIIRAIAEIANDDIEVITVRVQTINVMNTKLIFFIRLEIH